MIKVAVVQRICPHYRVPIFQHLAARPGIELTLYYGRGEKTGTARNADSITGFNSRKLPTLSISLNRGKKRNYLSFQPSLLAHLFKNKYDVIVVEGGQNLINNIAIIPILSATGNRICWWDVGFKQLTAPELPLRRKMLLALYKWLMKKCHAFIAYSSWAEKWFLSMDVDKRKIFIAQNTLDETVIQDRISRFSSEVENEKQRMGIQNKPVIITIGSLEKCKQIENLFIALSRLQRNNSDISLLIIGDGPHRQQLEAYAYKLNLRNVFFLGRLGDEISKYILMSDLFVLPAHGGLAINEAMIHGKPVIATFADGTESDLISNGLNGFIVEKGNINELTDRIYQILSNTELALSMGKESKRVMSDKVTIDNMINSIETAITFAYDLNLNI